MKFAAREQEMASQIAWKQVLYLRMLFVKSPAQAAHDS